MHKVYLRLKAQPSPVQPCAHADSAAFAECHKLTCIVNLLPIRRTIGTGIALERRQSRKFTQTGRRAAANLQGAADADRMARLPRAVSAVEPTRA